MKSIKTHLLTLLLLTSVNTFLSAQEYAIDKGAAMIMGAFSFDHKSGELFEDIDGAGTNTFIINSRLNYFATKGLFLGLDAAYNYQRTGANATKGFEIGPNFGYAFGNVNSKIYPYFILGIHYLNLMQEIESNYFYRTPDRNLNGYTIYAGIGSIIKVYEHLGIVLELDYHKYKLNEKSTKYSGNDINFSIGFVVNFFK